MNTTKMRRPVLLTAAAMAIFAVGACETKTEVKNATAGAPSPAATSSPAISPEVANPTEAALQQMLGRWNGPEGTYIDIADKKGPDGKQQNPRKFEIEIKNLDKAEKYEGTANGKNIEFTRKGKTETVKSATGAETGMKGFEKETTCVVVTKGSEGFCKKPDAKTTAAAPAASPAASPNSSPASK
jgi:hypothetical protein